ncbi:MAG: hypothetical protein HY735_29870 [Verrucomicrobia bacterium]|nr:hypothetical protein [Verrucomicrobiota bacterium]
MKIYEHTRDSWRARSGRHGLLQKLILACLLLAGLWPVGSAASEDASANDTKPTRYVIGVSPFLDGDVKDPVYRRIVGFLVEDMPLGSSLWLCDAYHLQTITQVEIPHVRAFRSAKTRANQFKEPIRKLKEFLAAHRERPATNHVKLDQAVRLPQYLDFVAENLRHDGGSIVVMVLGSPLYLDHKEPRFSMVDGYFPSDGHLAATRERSVFGIKGRGQALENMVVHLAYFGDPWVSGIHQEKILRFWELYLRGQGARLATFSGDLVTAFNAMRPSSGAVEARDRRYALDPAQSKIEMLRITRDVGVADWITRDVLPDVQRGPPSTTVGPMKIGIRWQGNIDLDLYSTPRPGAETLFFEHTRTPEGYYFKDHRSSPGREYEFIEFESPVNIWQVEAMINFYEGSGPGGPSGEIRIEFEGKIYTGKFSLPASRGNQGRSGRSQADFWTRINVQEILKLSESRREAAR